MPDSSDNWPSETTVLVDLVLGSTDYRPIFYQASDPTGSKIESTYRSLAVFVHPDKNKGHPKAEEAFKALLAFKEAALKAVAAGTYGQQPVTATLKSKRAHHILGAQSTAFPLVPGNVYHAESGIHRLSLVSVAASAGVADLYQAEVKALTKLNAVKAIPAIPDLLDNFAVKQPGGFRRVNVFEVAENNPAKMINLYDLMQSGRIPSVPAVHIAWIWRRVLSVLGFTHSNGVIHGAVLPQNLVIVPEQHGVMLMNWCYSVVADDGVFPALKAVPSGMQPWYPADVLAKEPPTFGVDLAMAAWIMDWMSDPADYPDPMRRYFKGCRPIRPSARPQDAGTLLEEFDQLLESMGGPFFPRKFREFIVPPKVTK